MLRWHIIDNDIDAISADGNPLGGSHSLTLDMVTPTGTDGLA